MKTINCAECGKEVEYEPPKGYPDKRKYCHSCSEKKKATWDAQKEPAVSGSSEFETVPMNPPKPTSGYKLTEENIRIGALTCAIEQRKSWDEESRASESPVVLAKKFEDYIRNGK